jgi:phosphoribosylaminoimidazolecarboxamide formyltransferase / IMP cyclohydrolase
MQKIERALISVSDKTGLAPFARSLAASGIEIISTGGTANALQDAGIPVRALEDYTGFPEMLDGRVKTLHPSIHGGLLFLRADPGHCETARAHGIAPIDLVVVNLYPFEQTVARPTASLEEAVEQIDIGGPALLRSAAKNHESVTVITDPADYLEATAQIQASGSTTLEFRRALASKAFTRTAAYDQAISAFLTRTFKKDQASTEPAEESPFPETLRLSFPKVQSLRYGENPHQQAALYGAFPDYFRKLHGKELSYNNILDLTAAAQLVAEFDSDPPTLAILKHTNPCGVGQARSLAEAWEKACATDTQAPFGGIIAVNVPLDAECARLIAGIFSEVIVAPRFESEALEVLQARKNLRLIEILQSLPPLEAIELRSAGPETLLAQQKDVRAIRKEELKIVTKRQPSPEELRAMLFGWRVVKHVKSNAIVFAGPDRTLGIGAGQMSRVDSSRIAIWKAGEARLSLEGSVVCSDAFFPFPDALIAAAEAGAGAAIQPGGSVKDASVIEAADARQMAMAFTGIRHFRH